MPKLTRQVRSLESILLNADLLAGELGSPLWWRGHGVGSWKLLPSIFRITRERKLEWALATDFLQRAPSRTPTFPRGDELGKWLYLMQHHQLPTRLLDWTESILVAAYFATEPSSSNDAVIWGLNPHALNEIYLGERGIAAATTPPVVQLIEAAFSISKEDPDRIIAFYPDEVDARMMLQQSAFTIHGKGRTLTRSRKTARVLARLVIPADRKEGIRQSLSRIGIRRSSLFPDLVSLASDIRHKWVPRDGFSAAQAVSVP